MAAPERAAHLPPVTPVRIAVRHARPRPVGDVPWFGEFPAQVIERIRFAVLGRAQCGAASRRAGSRDSSRAGASASRSRVTSVSSAVSVGG